MHCTKVFHTKYLELLFHDRIYLQHSLHITRSRRDKLCIIILRVNDNIACQKTKSNTLCMSNAGEKFETRKQLRFVGSVIQRLLQAA